MIISGKDCGAGLRGPSSCPSSTLTTEPHCFFYPTGGLAQDTDERNQSSQCWQRPPLAARPTLPLAAGPELRGDAGVVEGGA